MPRWTNYEVTCEVAPLGKIHLTQSTFGGDPAIVVISPDQVDVLVCWLQEAKAEAD
jgi:hypothetical protein